MQERKIKITGGVWEAYKQYKKEKIKPPVDRTTYSGICKAFNKALANKIITESFEYKIPHGLGHLRIRAAKQKLRVKDGKVQIHKMRVDWKNTWELWHRLYPEKTRAEIVEVPNKKLIVHTNEHTDGYYYMWCWDKRMANFRNQTVYMFKPVKGGANEDNTYTGRLGLSSWINSDERHNEYYE